MTRSRVRDYVAVLRYRGRSIGDVNIHLEHPSGILRDLGFPSRVWASIWDIASIRGVDVWIYSTTFYQLALTKTYVLPIYSALCVASTHYPMLYQRTLADIHAPTMHTTRHSINARNITRMVTSAQVVYGIRSWVPLLRGT